MSAHDLPQHVAIVMDGNGRWAEKRKLSRNIGHQAGLRALRGGRNRPQHAGRGPVVRVVAGGCDNIINHAGFRCQHAVIRNEKTDVMSVLVGGLSQLKRAGDPCRVFQSAGQNENKL